MIKDVVTCGECIYFERISPNNSNGWCRNENVASDNKGGACFSCWRSENDYCSFGYKNKIGE